MSDNTSQWRLHRYAGISFIGWLIDVVILAGLLLAEVPVFAANCVSAGCAVAFIFAFAQHKLFDHDVGRGQLTQKFLVFVLFNVLTIGFASLLIHVLTELLLGPIQRLIEFPLLIFGVTVTAAFVSSIAAKLVINPLRAYANYALMGRLLEGNFALR